MHICIHITFLCAHDPNVAVYGHVQAGACLAIQGPRLPQVWSILCSALCWFIEIVTGGFVFEIQPSVILSEYVRYC